MNAARFCFDYFYSFMRPFLFYLTRNDPEFAHDVFVSSCVFLHEFGLEKFFLDNDSNKINLPFTLSNAAGLNKDGNISPLFLNYLGFDRVVVGTVTCDESEGNPRPRIKRLEDDISLLNWMGFPGLGAKRVAQNLNKFENNDVPLTINIGPTPGKNKKDIAKDLESCVLELRNIESVDRFELNISCSNIKLSNSDYLFLLEDMLCAVDDSLHDFQSLYLKVSPDSNDKFCDLILKICDSFCVDGFVISNSSSNHSFDRGGISGNLLYGHSLDCQKLFEDKISENNSDYKIIACGGIDSRKKIDERLGKYINEIQIFTPLIYFGPKLLNVLRKSYKSGKENFLHDY